MLVFQRVPEPKELKNRMHLDFQVGNVDEVTARVLELGGRRTEPGNTREVDGFPWRCMADPDDNEFCIYRLPLS